MMKPENKRNEQNGRKINDFGSASRNSCKKYGINEYDIPLYRFSLFYIAIQKFSLNNGNIFGMDGNSLLGLRFRA